MKKRLIVIGNGMVGHHFVEQFAASPAAAHYVVTVFGGERHSAYDRVHLSKYFQGAEHIALALCSEGWYREQHVDLHLGESVTSIDRARRVVFTEGGEYPYDLLVLATGSYPFVPPIPGNDHAHCLHQRAGGRLYSGR